MHPFLQTHGWTVLERLPQDGSARSYARVEKNGRKALFMDCGPLEDIGYVTRLEDFISIGGWLHDIGVSTPRVYEADLAQNVAVIEDFGRISMKQAIVDGANADALYAQASQICTRIAEASCGLDLPGFEDSNMRACRMRLVDWYLPVLRGQKNAAGIRKSYDAVWAEIEAQVQPYRSGFMHVDFHAENLMVLPDGALGVIDFQEGMMGPAAYDLVNLLEDMRMDVPRSIQDKLLQERDADFLAWYRILGTQFHGRLLGQCLRWAMAENKPQYLQYIPRLWKYYEQALEHPVLALLKDWSAAQGMHLIDFENLDLDSAKTYIAEDAI